MRLVIFILILVLSGCVTTDTNLSQEVGQLESRINYLEEELKKQQAENLQLKQQLNSLTQKEIRMPNAQEIQTALKNAGYYNGQIDGQIGTETKEAIKKFQEANGLNADGVIGSRTWEILGKYLKAESK